MYIQLWHSRDVSPRAYNSPRRTVAATQTRERIVAAAGTILGTAEGISGFSLQAVAEKAGDPEFGASVRERNERRRRLLSVLVRRMAKDRKLRPKALGDLIDVLFALTSFSFFSQLTAGGRTAEAACGLIQGLARDAVRRAMKEEMPVSAD